MQFNLCSSIAWRWCLHLKQITWSRLKYYDCILPSTGPGAEFSKVIGAYWLQRKPHLRRSSSSLPVDGKIGTVLQDVSLSLPVVSNRMVICLICLMWVGIESLFVWNFDCWKLWATRVTMRSLSCLLIIGLSFKLHANGHIFKSCKEGISCSIKLVCLVLSRLPPFNGNYEEIRSSTVGLIMLFWNNVEPSFCTESHGFWWAFYEYHWEAYILLQREGVACRTLRTNSARTKHKYRTAKNAWDFLFEQPHFGTLLDPIVAFHT